MQERLSSTARGGRVRGVVNFGGRSETNATAAAAATTTAMMMPSNVSVTNMSIISGPILKARGEAANAQSQPSLSGHYSPMVDATVPQAGGSYASPASAAPLFGSHAREEEQRQLSSRAREDVAAGAQYDLSDVPMYPSMHDMGSASEKPSRQTEGGAAAVLGVPLTRTQSKLTNRYDSANKNACSDAGAQEGRRARSRSRANSVRSMGSEADSLVESKKEALYTASQRRGRRCCGCLSLKAQLMIVLTLASFSFLAVGLATLVSLDGPCFCHGITVPIKLRQTAQWIHVTCLKEYMRGILYVVAVFGETLPSNLFHASSISSMDYLNKRFHVKDSNSTGRGRGGGTGADDSEIMSADDFMQTSVRNLVQELDKVYSQSTTMTSEGYAQILKLINDFSDNQLPLVSNAREAWVRQHTMVYKDLFNAYELYNVLAMSNVEQMTIVPNMLQQAVMSCYRIDKCWNSGAIDILVNVAEAASNIIINTTTVYLEVVDAYINPGGTTSNLAGLILKVMGDITERDARVLNIPYVIDEITNMLTPQTAVTDYAAATPKEAPPTKPETAREEAPMAPAAASSGTSDDLQYLLDAVDDNWVSNLIAACHNSFDVAMEVHTQYSDSIPYAQWIKENGDNVVNRMINATTPMALSDVFSSYFAYDIPLNSMSSDRPDNEAAVIANNYKNNKLLTFFDNLETLLQPHYDAAVSELSTSVQQCLLSMPNKGRRSRLAFFASLAFAFVLYVVAICIVRYRVDEAPVRFSVIAAIIGGMFALHIVAGLVLVMVAHAVSVHPWSLELRIIDAVLAETELVRRAAKTMAKMMRVMLLVNIDKDSFMSNAMDASNNITIISQNTSDASWLSTAKMFKNTFDALFKLGPDVMYHQMIAAVAEPVTRAMIESIFPPRPPETMPTTNSTCRTAMKTATLVGLTNTYINSVITSAVISGQSLAKISTDCSQVGLAAMDGFCTVAALVDGSVNAAAEDKGCYEPTVCQQPLQYGMLRSICDGSGMNSIINPLGTNYVGTALYYWNLSVTESIPNRETQIIGSLIDLMNSDIDYTNEVTNFSIWLTIIVCLVMQFLMFLIWHLLTGTSVLYSML